MENDRKSVFGKEESEMAFLGEKGCVGRWWAGPGAGTGSVRTVVHLSAQVNRDTFLCVSLYFLSLWPGACYRSSAAELHSQASLALESPFFCLYFM